MAGRPARGELLPQHVALLQASGIRDEVLRARGYRSAWSKVELGQLGFSVIQRKTPGLLLPVWRVDGTLAFCQYRPDLPRLTAEGKSVKYETPPKVRMALDLNPLARSWLGDPRRILLVTEGIRKADAAVSQGLCCLALLGVWSWRGTNAHGGTTALADWELVALNGRQVYIVFDSDVMVKDQVHQAVTRLRAFLESRGALVRLVYLLAGEGGTKVGLDDYLADGHSVDDLLALATDEHLHPPSFGRPAYDANALLSSGAGLLDDPCLLDRVDEVLAHRGLAGDRRLARLIYLALTSRFLDRPVNLVVEGPSAAGKTFLVSHVVALFPEEAIYNLTAASERALAYTEQDLQHCVIVIGEAAGLHRDGVGATIMRTITWEGRLTYEFVEKTSRGLNPRRIEKPGPTGFITTTTKSLDPELATRVLSITVRDDPEQSRLVVRSAGRRAATGRAEVDVAPFVAAQRWLATAGSREVIVPFAEVLADLVDVGSVRVRRDFVQLLSLIKASALLHQRQRGRDGAGTVVAAQDDYRIVHGLAADLFGTAAADGLTQAQREAVDAVASLCSETETEVGLRQIAQRLGIDKSAAQRRLARPLTRGYVVNIEDRRGRPARLKPGDPLPDLRPAIPTPEALIAAWRAHALLSPIADCNSATPPPKDRQGESFRPLQAIEVNDNARKARRLAGAPVRQHTPQHSVQWWRPSREAGLGPGVARVHSRHGGGERTAPADTEGLSQDGDVTKAAQSPETGGLDQALLRVGAALNWASVPYAPGRAIAPGRRAWLTFIRANPVSELQIAWEGLIQWLEGTVESSRSCRRCASRRFRVLRPGLRECIGCAGRRLIARRAPHWGTVLPSERVRDTVQSFVRRQEVAIP